MKKLLISTAISLLTIFTLHKTVLAQEDAAPSAPNGQTRCAPFNDLYKKFEADGFSAVFLGEQGKAVDLAIIQRKDGNWIALKFIKARDGTLIACFAAGGDQSALTEPDPKVPSVGVVLR